MGEHPSTRSMDPGEKVERARSLRALIREHRGETDQARRLAQPVVEALAELGVFRALVPVRAGGEAWDLPTWMRVVEELSTVDGSVGWVAFVGANGLASGWLGPDAAQAVFGGDPIGLVAGAGARGGRAKRVDGGYVLTGRWSFASAAPHAAWFLAGYDLASEEDGASLKGLPVMLLPARDVSIVDTWQVGGLRGTGSHDFRVDEAFVPDAYVANPGLDPPRDPGPWYRLPVVLALGIGLGPVALGMARGAVDCFVEVMGRKTDGTGARHSDRLTVQERLAQAEAVVRSARAFLYEAADDAWRTVSASGQLSDRQAALLRLANMHAMASGARAIDLVYHAAGTSGIFTSSLLERFFRDVHVATQHRLSSPEEMYRVGQVLLSAAHP
jgi:alkylation response protein AidB-like acyl-CoA dehydrogenase